MSGLDPTFTDLPYRALGDAALARARELGAGHADFRFERVRYQYLGVRDGVLQGASDSEDLGFAVRVIHQGSWGFASGVVLTARGGGAGRRDGGRGGAGGGRDDQPPGRARRRAGPRRRHLGQRLRRPTRSRCRSREKAAVLIDWTERLRRAPPSTTRRPACSRSHENKYYADLAGTRTTQQRVRMMPGFEAMGAGADTFDSMASIAPPVGRGWEYVVGSADQGAWDWDAEIDEVPELLAEKLKAPSVEAGTYDLVIHPSQPVADDPRVDRPRHRARPRARLRGQLRRHVVRDHRQARHACSTAARS